MTRDRGNLPAIKRAAKAAADELASLAYIDEAAAAAYSADPQKPIGEDVAAQMRPTFGKPRALPAETSEGGTAA